MQNKRLCCASLALVAMLVSANAIANSPLIEPRPAPMIEQTVQELLKIDASRALAAEREKATNAGARPGYIGPIAGLPQGEEIGKVTDVEAAPVKLASIYGVGNAVLAEVIINGAPVVFSAGKTSPVRGKAQGWALRRILTPCVDLVEPDGGALRLCSYRARKLGNGL